MAMKSTFTAFIKNSSCRVHLLNGMCRVQYEVSFMDKIWGTMSITKIIYIGWIGSVQKNNIGNR